VARVLLVGGGERARALARDLVAEGHAVRATTRDPARAEAIAAAGAEPYVGDPDRVGSLVYGLEAVTVLVWLLGCAQGDPAAQRALHTDRLRMMLERTVDTMVRGVVYEAAGTADPEALRAGAAIVREAHDTWSIPVALLEADPRQPDPWRREALRAVAQVLSAPPARYCAGETR
jgi:hypothetical protein